MAGSQPLMKTSRQHDSSLGLGSVWGGSKILRQNMNWQGLALRLERGASVDFKFVARESLVPQTRITLSTEIRYLLLWRSTDHLSFQSHVFLYQVNILRSQCFIRLRVTRVAEGLSVGRVSFHKVLDSGSGKGNPTRWKVAYLLQFVHVLFDFIANILGCLQPLCQFLHEARVHSFVVCLRRVNCAGIQSGPQLRLQTLIFGFQLFILSDETFNFFLAKDQLQKMLVLAHRHH